MFLWTFVAMTTLLIGCNGQTNAPTTVAPKEKAEEGIVVSAYASYNRDKTAQIRSFEAMPGYDAWNGSSKGIKFKNDRIQIVTVDVDTHNEIMCGYDYYFRALVVGYNFTTTLDTTQLSFAYSHFGIGRGTVQVAIDYITGLVYWVDSVFRRIVCAPLQKEKLESDLFKVVVDTNLNQPDGLAIDSVKKYMFWSDNDRHPVIERAFLDGEERKAIVTTGLNSPLSLEADHHTEYLYIIDSYSESILRVPYEGGNNLELVVHVDWTILYDLAIYKDVLMVTDIYQDSIYFFNKTAKITKEIIKPYEKYPETFYGIATYNTYNQPKSADTENCKTLACDHFCILTRRGPICDCADGFQMNVTTKKCDATHVLSRATVVANVTHICLVDSRSIASNNHAIKCIYTVIKRDKNAGSGDPPVRRRRQAGTSPSTTTPKATTTPKVTNKPTSRIPPTSAAKTVVPTINSTITKTTPTMTTTTTPAPTASPGDIIRHIEVDSHSRVVYFATVDNSIYVIPVDVENATKILVTEAKGSISGLAYDWINRNNLYHSDSISGNVYVTNVKTKATDLVNKNALNGTRHLVVLAHESGLAMIVDTENGTVIKKMGFAGENLTSLTIPAGHKLSSLAADHHSKMLFYVNQSASGVNMVYSLMYNSTTANASEVKRVQTVYSDDVFDLIRYQNWLVWFNDEHTFSSFDYSVRRVSGAGDYTEMGQIVDITILDTAYQPLETNPCSNNNGDCDQICITEHKGNSYEFEKVCLCSLGYVLAQDGKSCTTKLFIEDFAFVTDWTNDVMYQFSLVSVDNPVAAFPNQIPATFMGVFYDYFNKRVIWSELYESQVYASGLEDPHITRDVIGDAGYNYVNHFAMDFTTGNIYVSTYLWASVSVITPDGQYNELIEFFWEDVNGIAVFPQQGFILYCVYDSYGDSFVGKADLDGQNATMFIKGDHVIHPFGIAIDYANHAFYWSDSETDVIHKCDFEGICVNFTVDEGAAIKSITIDGGYLYYVSWNNYNAKKVNLQTNKTTELVGDSRVGRLDTISVFTNMDNINDQLEAAVCKPNNGKGDCSTICYALSNNKRRCGCEYGEELKEDEKTCSNIYQCPIVLTQWLDVNKTDKISIPVDEDCIRFVNTSCRYTCPDKYEPVDKRNVTVNCTGVGWNRDLTNVCKAIKCPQTIANGKLEKSCVPTIGNTCDFTCGNSYEKVVERITCVNPGNWTFDPSTICKVKTCSNVLPNGRLDKKCGLEADSYCDFECERGYKTDDLDMKVNCDSEGKWRENLDAICEEIECPAGINNGILLGQCSKKVGATCSYSCNSNFKKPVRVDKIHCLEGGKWFASKENPCLAKCSERSEFNCFSSGKCIPGNKQCDGVQDCDDNSDENRDECRTCPVVFPNGRIMDSCKRTHGSVCKPVCDKGFNYTSQSIICSSNNTWSPAHPGLVCKETMCPMDIKNGKMAKNCSRKINSSCVFTCNTKFARNKDFESVKCLESGRWNITEEMCITNVNGITDKNTGSDTATTSGLTVGMAVLGILLLAVIVVAAYVIMRHRRGGDSGYTTASYSNGTFSRKSRGNVEIENPGFGQSAISVRNDTADYDNIDPSHMQPAQNLYTPTGSLTWRSRPSSFKSNDRSTDDGIVNPTYMQSNGQNSEPLRDVAQIDITHENAVLTHDSWLREQANGPDSNIAGKETS